THDVVIRTNQELKRIFQALNGSNDVQIGPCSSCHYDQNMKWDGESLEVFPDQTLRPSPEAMKMPLFIVKGAVQVSLSREAVKWLNRINLTKLINQFNTAGNSVDEMLMSTLQIADEWEMPGRFTKQCFMNGSFYDGITRMVQWRETKEQCKAGFLRHLVCVLGTEDLPSISSYHHILVNK
ncbi:Core-2/I-Branching enzyme, partial [Ostertagia ostertagi]